MKTFLIRLSIKYSIRGLLGPYQTSVMELFNKNTQRRSITDVLQGPEYVPSIKLYNMLYLPHTFWSQDCQINISILSLSSLFCLELFETCETSLVRLDLLKFFHPFLLIFLKLRYNLKIFNSSIFGKLPCWQVQKQSPRGVL